MIFRDAGASGISRARGSERECGVKCEEEGERGKDGERCRSRSRDGRGSRAGFSRPSFATSSRRHPRARMCRRLMLCIPSGPRTHGFTRRTSRFNTKASATDVQIRRNWILTSTSTNVYTRMHIHIPPNAAAETRLRAQASL